MIADVSWALAELRRFIELTKRTRVASSNGYGHEVRQGAPDPDIVREVPVIDGILDREMPRWRELVPASVAAGSRWKQRREAALQVTTLLERREELQEKLGEVAPTLDASRLHPWAWDGARSMWGSQQYAQAVVDALKKVNAEAQLKVGRRDVSETDLFNQLFSLDPPKAGRPRLRLMTDDGSDTYSSVHRGARTFAEGLFAGIRNRHSHEVTDTPAEEQHALEQLAAVSVLARWVDDAKVVTAP